MDKQVSVDVITHKVTFKDIEGKQYRYIPQSLAELIYKQLDDPDKKEIVFKNPDRFEYVTCDRRNIRIELLNGAEKTVEDHIVLNALSYTQAEKLRAMFKIRLEVKKEITDGIVKNMVEDIRKKYK